MFGLTVDGGCGGIRTPVGVNPNGFQDRLVVTASIRIHEMIKLFLFFPGGLENRVAGKNRPECDILRGPRKENSFWGVGRLVVTASIRIHEVIKLCLSFPAVLKTARYSCVL